MLFRSRGDLVGIAGYGRYYEENWRDDCGEEGEDGAHGEDRCAGSDRRKRVKIASKMNQVRDKIK